MVLSDKYNGSINQKQSNGTEVANSESTYLYVVVTFMNIMLYITQMNSFSFILSPNYSGNCDS